MSHEEDDFEAGQRDWAESVAAHHIGHVELCSAEIQMGLLAAMPLRTWAVYCAIRSFEVPQEPECGYVTSQVPQHSVGDIVGLGRRQVGHHVSKLKKMGLLKATRPRKKGCYILGDTESCGTRSLLTHHMELHMCGYYSDVKVSEALSEAWELAESRGVLFEEIPFKERVGIMKRHLGLTSE